MTEPNSPILDPPQRLDNVDLQRSHLYAVLTYRGELASWNWAFFVPNPSLPPIGSSGTLFHVSETDGRWGFVREQMDVLSSPLVVAIIQLADGGGDPECAGDAAVGRV
ncbi:hypothetical protein AX16_009020 [Volvariella volvacea WC 439]|nr:hypothetical protein AX16_009020 [Volvariella volvacea WC 439]